MEQACRPRAAVRRAGPGCVRRCCLQVHAENVNCQLTAESSMSGCNCSVGALCARVAMSHLQLQRRMCLTMNRAAAY